MKHVVNLWGGTPPGKDKVVRSSSVITVGEFQDQVFGSFNSLWHIIFRPIDSLKLPPLHCWPNLLLQDKILCKQLGLPQTLDGLDVFAGQ